MRVVCLVIIIFLLMLLGSKMRRASKYLTGGDLSHELYIKRCQHNTCLFRSMGKVIHTYLY